MSETIIIPGIKPLTAKELVEYKHPEICDLRSGQKKVNPDNSEEEANEIKRLQNELKKQISSHRIDKVSGRCVANWLPEKNRVKVTKSVGKFYNFGYSENGIIYLNKYEALFLLQLNRLSLYFNHTLVSIEQAYHLLFGSNKSKDYNNYLVYSGLARSGYSVRNFENLNYESTDTKSDFVWEILKNELNPNNKISSNKKCHDYYNEIQKSMNDIKQKIKKYSTNNNLEHSSAADESLINFNKKISYKRQLYESSFTGSSFKKTRLENFENPNSYIDELKNEPEYHEFKDIFLNLESIFIPKRSCEIKVEDYVKNIKLRDFEIDFDVYLPKDKISFKVTPPKFRVIVLGPSEDFPNRMELYNVFMKQNQKISLVLMTVSHSKQIQGFSVHFT